MASDERKAKEIDAQRAAADARIGEAVAAGAAAADGA